MKLCVGAASRRVVEEAAKLRVHQIVASRRQVAYPSGYIGLSPTELVKLVSDMSGGATEVVRDHGGPLQGGFADDGVEALDADVEAGFDGLHIDVCKLPPEEQRERLVTLCRRYAERVNVEIGGEHDTAWWNHDTLSAVLEAGVTPSYVVVGVGTHVWSDRQHGYVHDDLSVQVALSHARRAGVTTKVHNMDWVGSRLRYHEVFDAYNLAPELGQVEVHAILTMLRSSTARTLLDYAYDTDVWTRWFNDGEGTRTQRAECAVRYLLEREFVDELIRREWSDESEAFVRRCVRDAIKHG